MADNKNGREDQADAADRRQRERDVLAALERADETEPPVDERALGDLEVALSEVSFPATGTDIVATLGDQTIESAGRSYAVADLVPETERIEFDAPETVQRRVKRPTIAAAMKRVIEASESVPHAEVGRSQREAYERTFRALKTIDADDEDEGIEIIADWIVDQIAEKEKIPGSRGVRRQAAKVCRANGYTVRDDEWLGV